MSSPANANLSIDQVGFTPLDLTLPYAKLARHITAIYEIVRLAPTNDPAASGSSSIGLSLHGRSEITEHLHECLDMIGTLEKWMMAPAIVAKPKRAAGASGEVSHMVDYGSVASARSNQPEDYLHPEFVRRQQEMASRLREGPGDDADETRLLGRWPETRLTQL